VTNVIRFSLHRSRAARNLLRTRVRWGPAVGVPSEAREARDGPRTEWP
jgi:hypothetical protein